MNSPTTRCVAEIVLHEVFDRAPARGVAVAHAFGHGDLKVEGQLLDRAVRNQVHVAPDRHQEGLGRLEAVVFLARQHPLRDKVRGIGDAVDVLGDPVQGLQVAQPALALLHVGLDHIALAALLFVALETFLQLGLDIGGPGALEDLVPQPFLQLGRQRRIAFEVACLEKRGPDRVIVAGLFQAVLHRPAGMANFQMQVPHHVEHGFDHALGPAGDFVGCQEQQVDVGKRRHLRPAIAAKCQKRDALAAGLVRHRVKMLRRRMEDRAHDAVGQIAVGRGRLARGKRAGLEGLGDDRAAV